MNANGFFRYENKLLILLSFIFAFVIFDRAALSFLVPFFDKELGLNNTQIGLLTSLLALAWAISGYLMGTLADKTGKRKQYLIIATCKLQNINPAKWLDDVLRRIPTQPQEQLIELLPQFWKPLLQKNARTA